MIKTLFLLLILALIVYSGIQFATPYFHYYAFKKDVEELIRVNINTSPLEMKERVMRIAKEYNIPIKEIDIILTPEKKYRVEASWEEKVNLLGIYEKNLEFFLNTSI
jgi:hypothetical protein